MDTNTFMNLLFIVLAIAGTCLIGFRFLGRLFDVKKPRLYKPLNILNYVKSAWTIFPNFVKFGVLLSATVLSIWIIYLAGRYVMLKYGASGPDYEMTRKLLANNSQSLAQYFSDRIRFAPRSFFNQTWRISKIIDIARFPIFVFFLYFLFRKTHITAQSLENKIRKYSIYILDSGILLTIFAIASLILVVYFFQYYENWQGIFPFFILANDVLGLFPASIAEGIFLYCLFEYYNGNSSSLKSAINNSLDVFPSLFIFNLCYFTLPPLIIKLMQLLLGLTISTPFSYGKGSLNSIYADAIVWFLRMVFFLTPFIIIKDGSVLKTALKKNVIAVLRAPADYFILVVEICIATFVLEVALGFVDNFIVIPALLRFNLVITATNMSLISNIVFIWFSIFVYCAFGAFAREKFLYEEM